MQWQAPSLNTDGTALNDLSGYKVIYGPSADVLTQSVSINDPRATSYTFQALSSGTWYFAVISIDSLGNQSTPTNVVSATL